LKPSYWNVAVQNLRDEEERLAAPTIEDAIGGEALQTHR
jgi:hypothetical protein